LIYYLGLGSNLGAKKSRLAEAVRRLETAGARVVRSSSLYRTAPVDVVDQPWFVNAVLKVESSLPPERLLDLCQGIEREMRRRWTRPKGPRPIDIDILLAGRRIVRSRRLVVPHPRLAARRFALAPLAEIAPRAVHPVLKKTASGLLRDVRDASPVIRLPQTLRFRAASAGSWNNARRTSDRVGRDLPSAERGQGVIRCRRGSR
jgi:2-amino-4-hydroxy-6-hydroxymethyldihydropteridine diphosphokinase